MCTKFWHQKSIRETNFWYQIWVHIFCAVGSWWLRFTTRRFGILLQLAGAIAELPATATPPLTPTPARARIQCRWRSHCSHPEKRREMCGTARPHYYARRSFQARARAGNASAFAAKQRDAKRNHCRTPRARLRRAARGGRARRADLIAQRIARTTTAGAAQLTTLCRTPANTEASLQYHRQCLQPLRSHAALTRFRTIT